MATLAGARYLARYAAGLLSGDRLQAVLDAGLITQDEYDTATAAETVLEDGEG